MAPVEAKKTVATTPTVDLLEAILGVKDAYSDDTRALVAFLRTHGYGLTLKGLHAYYGALCDRLNQGQIKAATFNKRLAGAKKRVRQLLLQGNAGLSAADRFRLEEALSSFKTVKTRGLALDANRLPTDSELARLIAESHDRLVRTLVPFLAETGLRISEALSMRQSDIVRAKGFYRVTIRGKANKEREILLAPWLLQRVQTAFSGQVFLFEHSGKCYSRIASTDRIKRESRAILGRQISAHTLRHYFATRLLKDGKSLKAVSRFLGHSSTQTTADIYQHDALEWEDLADATREDLYGGNGVG